MRRVAEQTTGLGGTERWFMKAYPRMQVCISSTDCPIQLKMPQRPRRFLTRLKRFLVSQAFCNAGNGIVICVMDVYYASDFPENIPRIRMRILWQKSFFENLQLLTLPSLYILETTLFCMSKCAMTNGRDIPVHAYETRGRDNYRTGRHRTVVYERLPSQAGVHFVNKLPNSIKNSPTPKVLKTRFKRFLVSQAFYNVDEFLAYDWETTH
ncbi:hypothetical protein J6590_045156 [Homalodisca vitripennis]|nr:hypothetical protein J6590_045156 [Homalodisca vitripennis]